jgi:hypothetical protein
MCGLSGTFNNFCLDGLDSDCNSRSNVSNCAFGEKGVDKAALISGCECCAFGGDASVFLIDMLLAADLTLLVSSNSVLLCCNEPCIAILARILLPNM